MWILLSIFAFLLAIFLYWKFGTRIPLPGFGGVGAKVSGIFGSLSPTSENGKKRVEFLLLLGLILVGVGIAVPGLYTWFGENKGLTLFITLIIIGYIIKGPKSTFVLWTAIIALLVMGIYNGLHSENSVKQWWSKDESAVAQHAPTKPVKTIKNTVDNFIVEPGKFKRVMFPSEATLIESFKVTCMEGCIVAVEHSTAAPICTGGYYAGQGCRVVKIVPGMNASEYRVEEVFFVPSGGKNLPLPENLRAFILKISSPGSTFVPVSVAITSSS